MHCSNLLHVFFLLMNIFIRKHGELLNVRHESAFFTEKIGFEMIWIKN